MNENTKIITNPAMAIIKKQKRERPVREKDQRNSQSSLSVRRGGERSPARRGGEGSLDEVSRIEG